MQKKEYKYVSLIILIKINASFLEFELIQKERLRKTKKY